VASHADPAGSWKFLATQFNIRVPLISLKFVIAFTAKKYGKLKLIK